MIGGNDEIYTVDVILVVSFGQCYMLNGVIIMQMSTNVKWK